MAAPQNTPFSSARPLIVRGVVHGHVVAAVGVLRDCLTRPVDD